jgi:xylulokinase
MLLLGIDLGSSSVKASVIDGDSGICLATAFYPSDEMKIIAINPGWAEQETEVWWKNLKAAIVDCSSKLGNRKNDIAAIGISYQMHGLVTLDKNNKVLRPSIIWCDSRAVEYGEKALNSLGRDFCLSHLLNSPGNFTASKSFFLNRQGHAPWRLYCFETYRRDKYFIYRSVGRYFLGFCRKQSV